MNVESGNKIRQLRLRKGITQDAQAKVLNVSFQTVSNWENNICMPDIRLLPEIAVYFGCTIDDLFSPSVQAQLQRIENMLEMQSTWNEDEFAQAVDFLTDKQAFVKKNPGYARGYLWLMDELITDYRLDETEMVCQQMAVLDESRRVPFCQGRIARVRGEHQRAEAIWKKMLSDYGNDWLAYANMADAMACSCRYDEAIAYYKKAFELQPSPKFCDAQITAAHIYEIQGNYDAAIASRHEQL